MPNSNKIRRSRNVSSDKTNVILNWAILSILIAGIIAIVIYVIVHNESEKKRRNRPYNPNPNPYRRCRRGFIWNNRLRACVRRLY